MVGSCVPRVPWQLSTVRVMVSSCKKKSSFGAYLGYQVGGRPCRGCPTQLESADLLQNQKSTQGAVPSSTPVLIPTFPSTERLQEQALGMCPKQFHRQAAGFEAYERTQVGNPAP